MTQDNKNTQENTSISEGQEAQNVIRIQTPDGNGAADPGGVDLEHNFNNLAAGIQSIKDLYNSPDYAGALQIMGKAFQEVQQKLNKAQEDLNKAYMELATSKELQPYIQEELKKPEYQGLSLEELFNKPANETYLQLFRQAIDNAQEAAKEAEQELPTVYINKVKEVQKGIDKLTWGAFHPSKLKADPATGKIDAKLNFARQGSKERIPVIYRINFDGLTQVNQDILKRLTPFDKSVYQAAGALWDAGNEIITLTSIHYAMGNTTRPSERQLEKIDKSLTKMLIAHIYVNNSKEVMVYKNRKQFVYDGVLLPFERIRVKTNGKLTEAAIKLFREPPLQTFAKEHGQITTVNIKLLQSPPSKTDSNLLLEDYLLTTIRRNRNNIKSKEPAEQKARMILETIYENTDIKTSKQKSRGPERIEGYLRFQKEQGFFTDYKFFYDDGYVMIYYTPEAAPKKRKR